MRMTLRNAALVAALLTAVVAPWAVSQATDAASPVERAAVPAPPLAGGGGGFRLSYDVYKSGFRALSLDFDVAFGDGTYRTDARLESAGIIGWLFEWRLDAVSAGQLQEAMVMPQRHRFANHWRGRVRSVEIDYQGGCRPTFAPSRPMVTMWCAPSRPTCCSAPSIP